LGADAIGPVAPGLEVAPLLLELDLLDGEPGVLQERPPLLLGVRADVRRVVQPLGPLDFLAVVERVLDQDDAPGDPRHLLGRSTNVREVVGRDPGRDRVEAPVGKGDVLCRSENVCAHPRRGIERRNREAVLAKTPGDVPAAGRHVERRLALRPRDEQVEVAAFAVRVALDVRLGALGPDVAHAASSTARRAASSIVASVCRLGGAASARIWRPSSAFVPSSRTTIGCSIVICSSACRIPRATSSPRVIPPKMLKKIERTCGSAVITSSASTTPCASPPPPRSQKFAGRPPTRAITSSVDMTRPAP